MARLTANQIRNAPAYSLAEAGGYLHVHPLTLGTWAFGRDYETAAEGAKRWPPLFEGADPVGKKLSFVNLVEANTLAAMRKDFRLKIPTIRDALNFVEKEYGVVRPLCNQQFETDYVELFVRRLGETVVASRHGQRLMADMLRAALQRVERDSAGIPIRLYAPGPSEQAKSPYVAFDPTIAFGRPAIVGRGIPVAAIYDRFEAGESIASLAGDFGIRTDAVEEAIRQVGLFGVARAA